MTKYALKDDMRLFFVPSVGAWPLSVCVGDSEGLEQCEFAVEVMYNLGKRTGAHGKCSRAQKQTDEGGHV